MVPSHMDPTMLVCISILNIAPQFGTRDIAPIMNQNFPPSEMNQHDIQNMLDYIVMHLSDWHTLVRTLDPSMESIRILLRFLSAGLMRGRHAPFDDMSVPDYEMSVQGLQKALSRLIFYARQHGIIQGWLQRRIIPHTNASGQFYQTDQYFYWWDHPGNLGL